ncbi:alpha/beta hydrolase [Kutzneria viridogrisea]|nr:alpha/beta hydrolase [Kutzneria albida]
MPATATAAPAATSVPAVSWGACAAADLTAVPAADKDKYTCAVYAVPLDYKHPDAGSINLALMRRAANDQAHRIGSLFLNPGGPGGSGYKMPISGAARYFTSEVADRFDMIGFDPRGVGRSTPLRCFNTQEDYDRVFAKAASVPVSRQEEKDTLAVYDEYGDFCSRIAGPLKEHMSTADVARDLDRMRAAVGDTKLNYVGFSYGTLLGATYANMFPNNARAIIIDGNVDPKLRLSDGLEYDRQRTKGFEFALDALLKRCDAAGAACAFSGGARAKFDDMRDTLKAKGPVTLANGTKIGYPELVNTTASTLYRPAQLESLTKLFQDVYQAVHPKPALAAQALSVQSTEDTSALVADAKLNRFDVLPDALYTADDSYYGVNCSDKPFSQPASQTPRIAAQWEKQMPTFGRVQAWADPAVCPSWPVDNPVPYEGPWNKKTTNPVLVVGNYYDPATQYEFAKRMSQELGNARLLTVDAFGHCILGGSTCADKIAARYLVDLALPAPGTVCNANVVPFPAAKP